MRTRAQSSGAALISAIFLIIMLAALGISMASLSTVQHDTASKSILSTKVYYGAKTGLEWGIQRAIAAGTCTAAPPPFTPAGSGFTDVSVTVTCAASQHGAGATSFTYHIVSEAVTGTLGSLNYAQRRMEATVSNIP